MKLLKYIFLIISVLFSQNILFAQSPAAGQPSADFMLSNGKIFVVVAVVFTIVLGLFIYLFSLDKKLTKMEKMEK